MFSRSTWSPCSTRSVLVSATTRSERLLRSEMICSMVMSPTMERSDPSSDSLMISVRSSCCERKRCAARRTPSSVPLTLKLIEALIAILMRFLSTPSTVMPIWRCSSEMEKPCWRIGQTKVRPPITTRCPMALSGEARPAPRPTITSASLGGTRRMRRAMNTSRDSRAMTIAMIEITWIMKGSSMRGPFVRSGGRSCGGARRVRQVVRVVQGSAARVGGPRRAARLSRRRPSPGCPRARSTRMRAPSAIGASE